jgi:bacteriocin-like protein
MAAMSNQVCEPTNQADELTADELEQVSGGKGGKGDPKGQEYLVVTLKEVMISSVSTGS